MKTSLTLAIATLFALSLTACGGGTAGVSNTTPTTESVSPQTSSAGEVGELVGEGLSDSWDHLKDFGVGVWNGFKGEPAGE